MTRTDFNDPGYGEIGCLFMVFGIIGGWVVALGGAGLGIVPDPNPSRTINPLVTLAAVTVDAYVAGTLAGVGVIALTGRARPLRGAADWIVVVAWVFAPAATVVWLTWTTVGDALAIPLAIGAIAISGISLLWDVLRARARRTREASAAGGRNPRVPRPKRVSPAVARSTGDGPAPDDRADEDPVAPFSTTRRARLPTVLIVALFAAGVLFLVAPGTPAGRVGEAAFGLGLVVAFGFMLWAVLAGGPLPRVQRLGVALLSLSMIGVGVITMLLAAGVQEAMVAERSGALLILILGVALVPLGAWAAFWSRESLFVRACGLVCIPIGAWMVWASVAPVVEGLLR